MDTEESSRMAIGHAATHTSIPSTDRQDSFKLSTGSVAKGSTVWQSYHCIDKQAHHSTESTPTYAHTGKDKMNIGRVIHGLKSKHTKERTAIQALTGNDSIAWQRFSGTDRQNSTEGTAGHAQAGKNSTAWQRWFDRQIQHRKDTYSSTDRH